MTGLSGISLGITTSCYCGGLIDFEEFIGFISDIAEIDRLVITPEFLPPFMEHPVLLTYATAVRELCEEKNIIIFSVAEGIFPFGIGRNIIEDKYITRFYEKLIELAAILDCHSLTVGSACRTMYDKKIIEYIISTAYTAGLGKVYLLRNIRHTPRYFGKPSPAAPSDFTADAVFLTVSEECESITDTAGSEQQSGRLPIFITFPAFPYYEYGNISGYNRPKVITPPVQKSITEYIKTEGANNKLGPVIFADIPPPNPAYTDGERYINILKEFLTNFITEIKENIREE